MKNENATAWESVQTPASSVGSFYISWLKREFWYMIIPPG